MSGKMKEKFEELKNGCPFIRIGKGDYSLCTAHGHNYDNDNECYYKNCPFIYWMKHLNKRGK